MLREKREEVHKFIDEQLKEEYMRPLKSPQMIPTFFVRKKDFKKHIVQDYRYLNEWTIKNNYPLPLILDIISTKKVSTKLVLHWSYNNVQIKEENE